MPDTQPYTTALGCPFSHRLLGLDAIAPLYQLHIMRQCNRMPPPAHTSTPIASGILTMHSTIPATLTHSHSHTHAHAHTHTATTTAGRAHCAVQTWCPQAWRDQGRGAVRVFRQDFPLEDAIGSHACSLAALACVLSMTFLLGPSYPFTL
jgi:hypothetical protein